MATTPVYGGGNNGYIPSAEASNKLVVDFVRKPDSFPLNSYVKYIPVNKMVFNYAKFEVEDRMRITDATYRAHYKWQDGADAPTGDSFGEKFSFPLVSCTRYAEAQRLGWLFAEKAAFSAVEAASAQLAQFMMTLRTQRVATKLQTTANWPTANTSAVSSISGVTGKWDLSTTARSDIKRSLDYGTRIITLATGGVIKDSDLLLVLSKRAAEAISQSQEIRDYIKGGPDAKPWIIGKDSPEWRNRAHGLPDMLYGKEIVIEDTVKATSARGATRALDYVYDYTKPVIVARPGSLIGASAQSSDFSTVTVFGYTGSKDGESDGLQDMAVETLEDNVNRRTTVRVVDNTAEDLTAGLSGFCFSAAIT